MIPIRDFEILTDEQKNSLIYMRFCRDQYAHDVAQSLDMEEERAQKLVDDLVLYRHPNQAYQQMRSRFLERNSYSYAEQLDMLQKLSLRVARLEREACKVPLEGELRAA